MRLDWRGLLLFLGLLSAVAASSYLLNFSTQTPPALQPMTDQGRSYYLKGASIIGLDDSGVVLYELDADYIRHNPSDDSVALERVRMDYQASPTTSWVVEAEEGRIDANHDLIELSGNVEARTGQDAGTPSTVLTTSELQLEPETSIASTSSQVRVEMNGKLLSGTGMHADLRQEKLQLESNVHGRFIP